jgi:hypothetical protein
MSFEGAHTERAIHLHYMPSFGAVHRPFSRETGLGGCSDHERYSRRLVQHKLQ